MNDQEILRAHYVTLDTVLDVRLDVLMRALDGKPTEEVESAIGQYMVRLTEFFLGEDMGHRLMKDYESRDITHLENSTETRIPDYIYNEVTHVCNHAKDMGIDCTNTIYLNMYPYKMTEELEDDVANAFLNSRQFDRTMLKVVNKPPCEITPTWLKNRKVGHAWDVDGINWLNLQAEIGNWDMSLPRTPAMILNVPAILTKYTTNVKAAYTGVDEDSGTDVWDTYSLLVSELLKLNFMSPTDFSSRELSHELT